jgi:hypothetical protein
MTLFFESLWRAMAYCLMPRVIVLSLVPLFIMTGMTLLGAYVFWDTAMDATSTWLIQFSLLDSLSRLLTSLGLGHLKSFLIPMLVLMVALPCIVALTLMAVSWIMTPMMVGLVARRRFAGLARLRGGTWWRSMLFGLGVSLLAVLAMLASLPLWLIPPLALVLPPLIWGWLIYQVMGYDVLSAHASDAERAEIFRRYRAWMLLMGVMAGYMGSAPGMLWALGGMAVVFAPVLVPLAIWIYVFVFAFSALWFAHFCLAALAQLRSEPIEAPPTSPASTLLN